MKIFENTGLRPAEDYSFGDVTSLLPLKLTTKDKITIDEATEKVRIELQKRGVEYFSIERGFLNFRIATIKTDPFLQPEFCEDQTPLSIAQLQNELATRLRENANNRRIVGEVFSKSEQANLLLYLALLPPDQEPDLWVPKFREAANLRWYLYETVSRLKRIVEASTTGEIKLEAPHRNYCWHLAMLPARAYRAAKYAEIHQFAKHLKVTLDQTNKLLLQKREGKTLNILSSALSVLSNIITLVDCLE